MDTAKFEKQVTDAGKTTASIGWLAIVVAVIVAVINMQHVDVAVTNLVLFGGLGLWMLLGGKKAQKQAAGRNFKGFRRTLTQLVWGMGAVSVLMLLSGGGPGILLLLLAYWDIRAIKAAKKLDAGAGVGPASSAPVSAAVVTPAVATAAPVPDPDQVAQPQPEQGPETQQS